MRDEKVKVLKSIATARADGRDPRPVPWLPVGARSSVGLAHRDVRGIRLDIDSWRWAGVPFYIRAGKSLPVTCTEVNVHLRRAPRIFPRASGDPNYFRFRISPEMSLALGVTVMTEADKGIGQNAELVASSRPGAQEMMRTNAC
jgi:glucose-6-phosphate 1-dehydrogenase